MKLWFKGGSWASKRAARVVETLRPEAIRRIAVIRHAALGDMVLTRPFLLELRRFFPNAEITLSLCSNYTRGAPEDLVDRVHVVYGSDRKDVPLKQQIARARELGEQDLIFDLASTARSLYTCVLNKAKLKIGFPYKTVERFLFYDLTFPRSDFHHETDTMLDAIKMFGHRPAYPPCYAMPGEAAKRERLYIVYFPSASTPKRCWPKKSYGELVDRMSLKYPDYEHIVLEGIADWEKVDDIVDPLATRGNVLSMQLNDYDETVSFVKGATLLIANDTGIRNLAVACETPTVGIFSITPVFRYWPRHSNHEVVFCIDGSVPPVADAEQAAANVLISCAE